MSDQNNRAAEVTDVSPPLLSKWLAQGEALLVDVREDFEHAEERIEGAALAPLSKFDPQKLRDEHGDSRLVFLCRTGKRSREAAQRYRRGDEAVFHAAGGIENWKAAGHAVLRPPGGPRLPIMRQVQIVAGSLVVVGTTLGWVVAPPFLVIPAFVGCGLVFAGASGWCGMALLLARMPWNRTRTATDASN